MPDPGPEPRPALGRNCSASSNKPSAPGTGGVRAPVRTAVSGGGRRRPSESSAVRARGRARRPGRGHRPRSTCNEVLAQLEPGRVDVGPGRRARAVRGVRARPADRPLRPSNRWTARVPARGRPAGVAGAKASSPSPPSRVFTAISALHRHLALRRPRFVGLAQSPPAESRTVDTATESLRPSRRLRRPPRLNAADLIG